MTPSTEEEWFASWEAAWRAGSYPALIEAIAYCHQFKLPLPDWLALATIEQLQVPYWADEKQRSGGKRGRDGSLKGSETARHRDFVRYRLAKAWLGSEDLLPEPFNKRIKDGRTIARHEDWSERDREIAVFKYVSSLLREGPNKFAFGSWERVEASYRKITEAIERGDEASYFVAGLGK